MTWFVMYTYVQTIMASKFNSFCNLLINMHSPQVAFPCEHPVLIYPYRAEDLCL
jgi:hypothetical protein